MKRFTAALVLAAQLLTLAPLPARAAYPTNDGPSLPTQFRVPKNKRVIVVKPVRNDAFASFINVQAPSISNGLSQAIDMLREQGCQVDIVSCRMFQSYANGTKLWRELGNTYGLCIVDNPGNLDATAGDQRYVNGDSTNVQLLVVGGVRANNANHWATTDTLVRGMFDCASVSTNFMEIASSVRFGCLISYDPSASGGLASDTLWGDRFATGRSVADSAGTILKKTSGGGSILGVYRVLHPVRTVYTSISWAHLGNAGDTLNTSLPATVDSTVGGAQYMGPIWKVKYAPSAVNTDTSEVWFYKFVTGNIGAIALRTTPTLMWACIARFIDVAPIKYALDFDDVVDINDSDHQPRWRQSAAESLLAGFDRFGLKVGSNGINPRAAPGYIRAFTPETETQPYALAADSVPWIAGQPGHNYIKKLIWTHHSHDSTNGSISSNVVGGYGGYQPSGGATGVGNQQSGRRFASRWNPGATDGNFVGAGGNFGILQRLQWSDSVRNALGVRPDRPPYLTFPANCMLPVNWRGGRRGAVDWPANASDSIFTSGEGSCPVDSVLWAFDYFLNRGLDCGTGKMYLRSGIVNGNAVRNLAMWADRDSFVATTIGWYPRDRWTTRVGNRLIQEETVHSFNQGAGTRAAYLSTCAYRAANWIGLSNKHPHSEVSNPLFGEDTTVASRAMDYGGMLSGGTSYRDLPARQSTRIQYLHPSGLAGNNIFGFAQNPSVTYGDYPTDCIILGMHAHFRVMDRIAGRQVTKCVMPWEVWVK